MAPRPQPPRPPQPVSRPQTRPVQQKAAGSGMRKWVFACFMLIVVYVGYVSILRSPAPQEATTKAPKPVTVQPPAATWQQSYLTTLNYGGQVVNVRTVDVRNLDRTTANIAYTISIVPKGPTKWIQERSNWKVGRASRKVNANRITVRKVDRSIVAIVRFQFPTDQLEQGSYLQMTIPQFNARNKQTRFWPVRLGLEIPLSHRGIEERTGVGGF
jgi:hypothetical protein